VTPRTMTEQALIDELQSGRARLLADESAGGLLHAIRRRLLTITNNLYILRWIPEQGEDLYDVLVDGTSVAHVEIPRGGNRETVFELSPVEAYQRRAASLTKTDRRKLQVAMQLARGS
jgi:hypothetical protein